MSAKTRQCQWTWTNSNKHSNRLTWHKNDILWNLSSIRWQATECGRIQPLSSAVQHFDNHYLMKKFWFYLLFSIGMPCYSIDIHFRIVIFYSIIVEWAYELYYSYFFVISRIRVISILCSFILCCVILTHIFVRFDSHFYLLCYACNMNDPLPFSHELIFSIFNSSFSQVICCSLFLTVHNVHCS